jgi:hypothetical protein
MPERPRHDVGLGGPPWLVIGPDGYPPPGSCLRKNVTLGVTDASRIRALEREEPDVESVVCYRTGATAQAAPDG